MTLHIDPDDENQADLIIRRLKAPKPKYPELRMIKARNGTGKSFFMQNYLNLVEKEGATIRFLDTENSFDSYYAHDITNYSDTILSFSRNKIDE